MTALTAQQAQQIAKQQPVTIAVRDGKGGFTPVGARYMPATPNKRRFTAEMYGYTQSFASLSDLRTWANKTISDLDIAGMGVTLKVTDNHSGATKTLAV